MHTIVILPFAAARPSTVTAKPNVNDVPAVATHEQLAARGRWTSVATPGGDIPALIPPHNLASVSPRMGAVPSLGQHTKQVLTELGIEAWD